MALSDYTQLEYIESTGTQYIDTLFCPNQDTTCEVSFYKNTNNACRIFGAWSTSYHENTYSIGTDGPDNSYIGYDSQYDGGDNGKKIPTIPNGNHIVGLYKNIYKLDNNIIKTYNYQNFTCTKSIYLFVQHTHNEALEQYGAYRLYYCKIWDNNTLVRNMIPVKRKSDNVLGLYDKVNDVFYMNKGSGSFIAGPEIDNISNYEKLEYIESTGTQYIDTNYKPKNTTKIETQLEIIQKAPSTNFDKLFGANGSTNNYFLQLDLPDTQYFVSAYYNNIVDQGRVKSINSYSYNKKYKIIQDSRNFYIDDILQGTATPTATFTCDVNLGIFNCITGSGTSNQPTYMKLYYFKIYENKILIRDLIPVKRKSDSVIGLFDMVNNVFYTNRGTGTFVAGPNKYDGSQLQQNLLNIQAELNTQLDNMYIAFPELYRPYIELEYIESTGTQYIDTLQKGNSNTKIELKFYNSYTSSSEKAVFGSRTYPRSNCLMIGFYSNGWVCYNNGEGAFANILNKVTDLKLVKNNMYVLNSSTQQYELVKTYNSGSFTTPSNMILFGERRDNDVTQLSSIKVYHCKIYDENVLVRDFIPVKRKSDNIICMYDKVTKQFFTNQGTGNFIAGPEVN